MSTGLDYFGDGYYEPHPIFSPAVNDIYALKPPASEEEIAKTIRILAAAFPKLSSDTWALLSNRFAALRFSKERLHYILHVALETKELTAKYQFDRLSVPDFVSIERPMTLFSYLEALNHPQGKAYVYSYQDGTRRCHITTIDEAKESGLEWGVFADLPHNY